MRRTIVLLLCLVMLCSCVRVDNQEADIERVLDPGVDLFIDFDIDSARLWSVMESLDFPRACGTSGEERALAYLKHTLEDYGYRTTVQEFPIYKQGLASMHPVFHTDFFNPNPDYSELRGTGRNIIARSDRYDTTKKTIYLTAHYDTIPQSSGILDNATGVSVVLETARQLASNRGGCNLVVVFFSAEEYAMNGSRAFIAELSDEEKWNALGIINIDMVGQSDAGSIAMKTPYGRHNVLTLMINNQGESPLSIMGGGTSDELSGYMAKIPVVTLANQRPDRSRDTETDQFQYIDLGQMVEVTHFATSLIATMKPSDYNTILGKRRFPINIDIHSSPWASVIDGSALVGAYLNLKEEGHDSDLVYTYEAPTGGQCEVAEESTVFIHPDVYSNWGQINGPYTFYHILEDPENDAKAYYIIGQTFGRITGEITSTEAYDLIKAIYAMKLIRPGSGHN